MAQVKCPSLSALGGALCGLGLLALASAAGAQQMSTNSSSYNGGWGRTNGSENQSNGVSLVSRDENGNREIVNGIIDVGAQTVSARAAAAGAASGYSGGVGSSSGSALAVGNSLTVTTTGNYNTVIVDSTQINNGDISANVSGGVGE